MDTSIERHGGKRTYDDFGVGVEIVMRLTLTENLVDVDVHSSIIVPIVGQCDDEMDVVCFRGSNDIVLKDDVSNGTRKCGTV